MIESIAIIDIGTNSIKFCIAKNTDGKITSMVDSVFTTRIGENVQQTGMISPSAMERNLKRIHELCNRSRQAGVSRIIAIGTMIFRHATNSHIFIQKVQSLCGIHIHVLSGDDEARLSYLAALSSINNISGSIAVLDTGGGSTELTFGKDQDLIKTMSFDIGAVILTEAYCTNDPVTQQEIEQIYNQVQQTINLHELSKSVNYFIGSCGAITTMAAVKLKMSQYDPHLIHGSMLTRKDVQNQLNLFSSKTVRQREDIPGVQKGRADIALAGACIVESVMSQLRVDQIIVCDRGLRYGVIYEFFRSKKGSLWRH
jgi:exopolyphosphatase/guanosine-5'-triphosphate,3'-diphosphate pyrophosphatase